MWSEPRRVAPVGIAAGLFWLVALAYLMFDELEYSGEIASNPIPGWIGLPALMIAAAATAVTLRAVQPGPEMGFGTSVCFGIAYLGAAFSLVPLWPAIFLGPFLLMIGLVLVGWAMTRTGSASRGHLLHAIGLPAMAVTGPLLDLSEVAGGELALIAAVVLMAAGSAWIGVDADRAERDLPLMPETAS